MFTSRGGAGVGFDSYGRIHAVGHCVDVYKEAKHSGAPEAGADDTASGAHNKGGLEEGLCGLCRGSANTLVDFEFGNSNVQALQRSKPKQEEAGDSGL
ncbi:hypothetical protein L7F22_027675 [Adiantum nelumboides]|nr:hypothetical protein [Adiantum nelumboides]